MIGLLAAIAAALAMVGGHQGELVLSADGRTFLPLQWSAEQRAKYRVTLRRLLKKARSGLAEIPSRSGGATRPATPAPWQVADYVWRATVPKTQGDAAWGPARIGSPIVGWQTLELPRGTPEARAYWIALWILARVQDLESGRPGPPVSPQEAAALLPIMRETPRPVALAAALTTADEAICDILQGRDLAR